MNNPHRDQLGRLFFQVAAFVIGAVVCLAILVGILTGYKAWHRSQVRADANNKVRVTHILIRNAQQQAQVVRAQNAAVQARAEQRLIEARGIRHAQDEISATLTDRYLQHEAIKAQVEMAHSQNHSVIYVPSGANGVPLVRDTSKDDQTPEGSK